MRQKIRRRVLKLRKLRRDREMSQAELARRAALIAKRGEVYATAYISEIESGKVQPSLETAKALAGVFDVTVDEAFSYVEVAS